LFYNTVNGDDSEQKDDYHQASVLNYNFIYIRYIPPTMRRCDY